MNRFERVFPFIFLLALGPALTEAATGRESGRVTIEWPSREFPELQAAINAAPDNAIIQIREGVYQIDEPLFVRGKQLVIVGAGSGRQREDRLTHLVGPPPRPVLDDRGNLVLRAEAVEGLWNFVAANVVIKDMKVTGFDAGIVSKPDEERGSGPTVVKDVVITDTGRGILSLSSSDLSVEDCTISRTQWNAISFGPKFPNLEIPANLTASAVTLIDPDGAGIYFENTLAYIDAAAVLGAQAGGIVGLASSSFILDSALVGNTEAGVLLMGGFSQIENNTILGTSPLQGDILGDGISLWSSGSGQQQMQAFVADNLIQSSERAGISVFGATVDLLDNNIFCSAFDMVRAEYAGFVDVVNDLGGNQCGCGMLEICAAVGGEPTPPPPVGGLE